MPHSSAPRHETSRSSTVIILKKMQGSVWRETGRTSVCPTPEWLSTSYGEGEYELRLKSGNRVLCMVGVYTASARTPAQANEAPKGTAGNNREGGSRMERADNGLRRSGADFQPHRRVMPLE